MAEILEAEGVLWGNLRYFDKLNVLGPGWWKCLAFLEMLHYPLNIIC